MKRMRPYLLKATTCLGVVAFLLFGCEKEKSTVDTTTYETIGEIAGLKSITDSFLVQVNADSILYPIYTQQGIFTNQNLTINYRNNLVDFLCQQLNGPCKYKAGNLFLLTDSAKINANQCMDIALTQNAVAGEFKTDILLKFTNFLSYQNAVQ